MAALVLSLIILSQDHFHFLELETIDFFLSILWKTKTERKTEDICIGFTLQGFDSGEAAGVASMHHGQWREVHIGTSFLARPATP